MKMKTNLTGASMKKYEVEIYEDAKGSSQIMDWIKELIATRLKKTNPH